MSNPIPKKLLAEFVAYMDAHNDDDLPDGAWFCVLEDAAKYFMKTNKLRGDRNDAAHQYLREKEPK
jgi:hypothetical protein